MIEKHGFLGLGSNTGNKRSLIEAALAALRREPEVKILRVAKFYRSLPLGGSEQDWYLNTVAEIATSLSPAGLLEKCQAVEKALGRVRTERWGPRTIDIDLVWLEGCEQEGPELTLPHPGAHLRSFVLRPLRELAPELRLRGHTLDHWLGQADPLGITEAP